MSAKGRSGNTDPNDWHFTPPSAILPLIPFVQFRVESVWDPCCGDGRLVQTLRVHKIPSAGNDLLHGYDYLKDDEMRPCVLTNPPYSIAQQFVDHAIEHAVDVFLLMRLNFLGAQKRHEWWLTHEPSALFVLSQRPSFTGQGTDATEYAWFYWGNQHRGFFHLK